MPTLISHIDNGMTAQIQRWPQWWRPYMRMATFIGLPMVVIVVALSMSLAAWQLGNVPLALAALTTLAGMGVNTFLKSYLHRTRPDTVYITAMKIKSFSFPSGHAFGSVATYGLFAYEALQLLPDALGIAITLIIAGLIITIGLSRIYLGAHYPTDVLGGWLLGGLTLLLVIAGFHL